MKITNLQIFHICDTTPLAAPYYLNLLNQSWPSDRLVVSPISGQGYFTFLYGHTKHNIHNRERGRKENKQTRIWFSSKPKKGVVCDNFAELSAHLWANASVYSGEIPTKLPGTLTHPLMLANAASESTGPSSCSLLFTASFCRLPPSVDCPVLSLPSSSGPVGDLARKPFVWVSHKNRQRDPLPGTHPHPHTQRMPNIVPHISKQTENYENSQRFANSTKIVEWIILRLETLFAFLIYVWNDTQYKYIKKIIEKWADY